jgi:hypothetical protein
MTFCLDYITPIVCIAVGVIIGNYITEQLKYENENDMAQRIIFKEFLKNKIKIKVLNKEDKEDDVIDIEIIN